MLRRVCCSRVRANDEKNRGLLMSISPWAIAGWALAAFLSCVILSVLALCYARWRQLLDLPGRRRSHAAPTPRGGGIAIVATLLLASHISSR